MNVIMLAKIETCLELAEGKTPSAKAADFKKKVLKVTSLSQSRFEELGVTDASYKMLCEGKELNAIFDACF